MESFTNESNGYFIDFEPEDYLEKDFKSLENGFNKSNYDDNQMLLNKQNQQSLDQPAINSNKTIVRNPLIAAFKENSASLAGMKRKSDNSWLDATKATASYPFKKRLFKFPAKNTTTVPAIIVPTVVKNPILVYKSQLPPITVQNPKFSFVRKRTLFSCDCCDQSFPDRPSLMNHGPRCMSSPGHVIRLDGKTEPNELHADSNLNNEPANEKNSIIKQLLASKESQNFTLRVSSLIKPDWMKDMTFKQCQQHEFKVYNRDVRCPGCFQRFKACGGQTNDGTVWPEIAFFAHNHECKLYQKFMNDQEDLISDMKTVES